MKPIQIFPLRAITLPIDETALSGRRSRRADVLYLQQLQAHHRSTVPIKDLNPSHEKPRKCQIKGL